MLSCNIRSIYPQFHTTTHFAPITLDLVFHSFAVVVVAVVKYCISRRNIPTQPTRRTTSNSALEKYHQASRHLWTYLAKLCVAYSGTFILSSSSSNSPTVSPRVVRSIHPFWLQRLWPVHRRLNVHWSVSWSADCGWLDGGVRVHLVSSVYPSCGEYLSSLLHF